MRERQVKIEELFWNNQIKLQSGWEMGYTGSGRTKGKVVKSLPLDCETPMNVSEVAWHLGTSTNIASGLIQDLEIPMKDGVISPEGYSRIKSYRTSIYYSMVARWLLLAPGNKQMTNKVMDLSAQNPLIAKIAKVLWN